MNKPASPEEDRAVLADDDQADDETYTIITGVDIPLFDLVGIILKFYLASCIATLVIGAAVAGVSLALFGLLLAVGVTLPHWFPIR